MPAPIDPAFAEQARRLRAQLKKVEAAERKSHAAHLAERERLGKALSAIGHESALGFIGYVEPDEGNETSAHVAKSRES